MWTSIFNFMRVHLYIIYMYMILTFSVHHRTYKYILRSKHEIKNDVEHSAIFMSCPREPPYTEVCVLLSRDPFPTSRAACLVSSPWPPFLESKCGENNARKHELLCVWPESKKIIFPKGKVNFMNSASSWWFSCHLQRDIAQRESVLFLWKRAAYSDRPWRPLLLSVLLFLFKPQLLIGSMIRKTFQSLCWAGSRLTQNVIPLVMTDPAW